MMSSKLLGTGLSSLLALAACSSGSDGTSGAGPGGGAEPGADAGQDAAAPTIDGCVTPKSATEACPKGTADTFVESVIQESPPMAGYATWAQLVIDAGGFYHATWGSYNETVWYATNRGGPKVEVVDLPGVGSDRIVTVRLAVDHCGNVHIAYALGLNSHNQIFLASRRGDHFEKREISPDAYGVELTLDDKGSPILLTTDQSFGASIRREANRFKPELVPGVRDPSGLTFSSTLGIVIGTSGLSSAHELGIVSSKDGGPWIPSMHAVSGTVDLFEHATRLTADASGTVHALYEENVGVADTRLYYASIAAPNAWSPEVAVPLSKAAPGREQQRGGTHADLMLTRSGEPQVLFIDPTAERVVPVISRRKDGVFQPPVPITAKEELVFPAGTIDENGRAHVLLASMKTGAAPARLLVQGCAP